MLSLFGRKPPAELTFNDRVREFWRKFAAEAPRITAAIDARLSADLVDETSALVRSLGPGFAWVYGPGADRVGHSLTVSGEGDIHLQLLALQWRALAPAVPGWTFHAARQPGRLTGAVEMLGRTFRAQEVWVSAEVDAERERIALNVWHPAWTDLERSPKFTVTFILLDEMLGEYGTGQWIGDIEFGSDRLADSFPLAELPDYVAQVASQRDWKLLAPGERYSLLRLKEPGRSFPRDDLLVMNTCAPPLVRDYIEARGELDDPLAGTGADYVFVSIDRVHFPEGQEVARRGEIEGVLLEQLQREASGRHIGGGLGLDRCYIDLLIFDGPRSLELLRKGLKRAMVPAGTMIEFFARGKRGQRIAL